MDSAKLTNAGTVRVRPDGPILEVILNRPRAINSLNLEMVRTLASVLDRAAQDETLSLVILSGEGPKGFCAGGDVKALAQAVKEKREAQADAFFREEYALDLMIHRFPKPVVVFAHGITMGGGLGLSAGADLVIVEEKTHMAMPETRIGFFPDVGASRWLFMKSPPGYPEYLALTGYDLFGPECVRMGWGTHYVPRKHWPEIRRAFRSQAPHLPSGRKDAAEDLRRILESRSSPVPTQERSVDDWVRRYFHNKDSFRDILEGLRQCSLHSDLCQGVFRRLSERSPTALALTFRLLQRNRERSLEEAFAAEERAARWMIRHPDYGEGVRARLMDKDDRPRWTPSTLEAVEDRDLFDFLD